MGGYVYIYFYMYVYTRSEEGTLFGLQGLIREQKKGEQGPYPGVQGTYRAEHGLREYPN